jgi:hypothetical protein
MRHDGQEAAMRHRITATADSTGGCNTPSAYAVSREALNKPFDRLPSTGFLRQAQDERQVVDSVRGELVEP